MMAVRQNTKNPLVHINPLTAAIVGFACLMITMRPNSDMLDMLDVYQWVGFSGVFVSIIVSILASTVFINLSKIKILYIRFFSEDSDFSIPGTISALFPALLTMIIFGLMRGGLTSLGVVNVCESLDGLIRTPFYYLGDSTVTAFVYVLAVQVFWFFGLHGGNLLSSVVNAFYIPADMSNVIFTKTFFDVFVFPGGAGMVLSLLLAIFIVSRNRSSRKIVQISAVPVAFNISELVAFGLPVVLNPIFIIPFVFFPVIACFIAYVCTLAGIMPHTTAAVQWTTPPLINAYIATGSVSGVLVQIFIIGLGTLGYIPFVIGYDNMKAHRMRSIYDMLLRMVQEGGHQTGTRLIDREDVLGIAAHTLANELQRALDKGELYVAYQPQVTIAGKVFGVEALLRWNHPLYGAVPPPLAVAIAEDSKLIEDIGLWVAEQGAKDLAIWKSLGIEDLRIAVNISVRQLEDTDLPKKLLKILSDNKIEPHEFEIEVTESVALNPNAITNVTLRKIHEAGIKVAIDDFGMGHSSLLYLRQFPVDMLKIDGTLSRNVLNEAQSAKIIFMIAQMCQSMNVKTLVEFVESEEQLELLRSLGVMNFQGYYFAKPLLASEIPKFIEDFES
jgi:lactose/cellobiose-specific phosphotransferase system IIC component